MVDVALGRRALAALAALSACSAPLPPCSNTGSGEGGGPENGLLFTGREATVTLQLQKASTCSTEASGAELDVRGPDNLPVESAVGEVRTESSRYVVDLSFTPQRAGAYHLRARFQPNLGVAQVDVRAAIDRAGEPDVLTVAGPLGVGCEHFAVTAHSTVLCAASGTLRVIRGGTLVQQLTGQRFAVHGDVVWVSNAFEVTRWLDVGSGELTAVMPTLSILQVANVLLPGTDEVWVLSSSHVRRYLLEANAFVLRENLTFSAGAVYPNFAARTDAGWLVAYSGGQCGSEGGDGGTLLCYFGAPYVAGATADGLWFAEGTLELREPGRSSAVVTLEPPPGSSFQPVQRQDTLPSTLDGFTVAYDGGDAALVKWDGTVFEAIPGWVIVQYADGRFGFRRAP